MYHHKGRYYYLTPGMYRITGCRRPLIWGRYYCPAPDII